MKSCPDCAATYPDDYAICPKDGASLHETTLWQIGTVVRGKYRILARLGEGGMAVVYKAHHEMLDELRALKVIRPDLARDTEFMSRFKNEAIMARKLHHPNAVRVDDLEIAEDGLPFIAMELVVGDTLETLVQRAGALPVSLALDIASNVCEALDAAHKLGLVHRDIKPENIVLVAQRVGPPIAKILDFGISRLRVETAGGKGLTQTGMVIGTPEYMSPEQALGKRGGEIDGRSDLYSLGLVMYLMLTGEMPFHAESTVEIILHHLRTQPMAPHRLKPGLGIPEVISFIVMKALEKDREKRFATGAEMAAAIKKARGTSAHHSGKVDWGSLSTAPALFGTERVAATPPANQHSPGQARPANSMAAASDGPMVEKTIYRSSARIGPPSKQFPTRTVLTLVALAVLIGGALAAWIYFGSWSSAKHGTGNVSGTPTPEPAKTRSPSPAGGLKTSETSKAGAASPLSHGLRLAVQKNSDYPEQAKITELNSLAATYYREGGCKKALPIYQQVLEADPGNPRAYAAVEKCYSKARNGVSITPTPTRTPDPSPNP